jgi:hypothetical protein
MSSQARCVLHLFLTIVNIINIMLCGVAIASEVLFKQTDNNYGNLCDVTVIVLVCLCNIS